MRGLVAMLVAGLLIAAGAFYFLWTNAHAIKSSEQDPKASAHSETDGPKPEAVSAPAEERPPKEGGTVVVEAPEEKRTAPAGSEDTGPKPEEPSEPVQEKAAQHETSTKPEQQRPQVHVTLPDELGGVQFGVSPAAITKRFPPAWQKETSDSLTLVHHPHGSRNKEYRFEFRNNMLAAVQLRFKVSNRNEQASIYNNLQKECSRRFGSLPDSGRTHWRDDRIALRLEKETTYVALRFEPTH